MSYLLVRPEFETRAVPRRWMDLLKEFSKTWGRPDGPSLGLHCSRCGQDVVSRNNITDTVYVVSCQCRQYASDGDTIV